MSVFDGHISYIIQLNTRSRILLSQFGGNALKIYSATFGGIGCCPRSDVNNGAKNVVRFSAKGLTAAGSPVETVSSTFFLALGLRVDVCGDRCWVYIGFSSLNTTPEVTNTDAHWPVSGWRVGKSSTSHYF